MSASLILVAGPNGSGKTTLALAYQALYGGVFLSADRIAEDMRSSGRAVSDLDAGREFFRRLRSLLGEGTPLIVESTLAGRGILRHIDRARALGYDTTILFLFLESADVCVARVQARARKGGHSVPDDDIRRRYPRSIKHFWRLHRLAVHRWHLYYNSGSDFVPVATGSGVDPSVVDDVLYEKFLHVVEGSET